MAITNFFIYSEDTKIQGNPGKLRVENPIQMLELKYLPSFYSICATFGISDIDFSKSEKLRITFYDPDNKPIIDNEVFDLTQFRDEKSKFDQPSKGMLDLNIDFRNTEFGKPGKYCTKLHIDEELISEHCLQVIKAK